MFDPTFILLELGPIHTIDILNTQEFGNVQFGLHDSALNDMNISFLLTVFYTFYPF
jgi:hypothetical protein